MRQPVPAENGIAEQSFDQTIQRIWGHLADTPGSSPLSVAAGDIVIVNDAGKLCLAGSDENGNLVPASPSNPPVTSTKKIAIVGRAPDTMNMAPFDDPSWEIWSLSNAASIGAIKRWDVWFELHDLDEGQKRWQQAYWDWLGTDHGKPLYIRAPHPHVPHGIVYPWDDVLKRFGNYFNNSIAEMLAIALMQGATDVGLYGVNMAQSDPVMHNGNAEYQHQRPSCEYMLGVARGLGVNVIVPDESDLLKCARIYGLHSDVGQSTRKVAVRMAELHQRKKEAETQRDGHMREAERWAQVVIKFEGAIEDCEFWKNKLQA